MKVSVFGGSQPKEGDVAYVEAMKLGKLLAQHGHTVLTGGYIGTMEAVSRGACEAGGHVIGVTCEDIEAWRPIKANAWVMEEIRKKTLIERLHALIHESDAALALPGGPGTLTEISLTWNLMIVESLHRRPLILIGDGWQSVFDQFFQGLNAYVPAHQRQILHFAKDVQTAVDLLESNVS
ncbi:MAG TPA: LOG family protein [Anaerolineales bacterium]